VSDKVKVSEIISQLDELLEANLEYTEETKKLRSFIRAKMTETLKHGIEQEYVPMTNREFHDNFCELHGHPLDDWDKNYLWTECRAIEQAVLARLGVAPTLDQAKAICEANGLAVVSVYNCLWCSNTGTIAHKGTTTLSPHCSCNGIPQSRYNQNKAMLEAAKDKP